MVQFTIMKLDFFAQLWWKYTASTSYKGRLKMFVYLDGFLSSSVIKFIWFLRKQETCVISRPLICLFGSNLILAPLAVIPIWYEIRVYFYMGPSFQVFTEKANIMYYKLALSIMDKWTSFRQQCSATHSCTRSKQWGQLNSPIWQYTGDTLTVVDTPTGDRYKEPTHLEKNPAQNGQ